MANQGDDKDSDQYIDIDQWQISLAVGVGVKTNPLIDSDHIPLVLIPDIAYYSESFYFDNGDIGFTWLEEQQLTFSTLLRLNSERAYFSFWHPANILLDPVSSTGIDDNTSGGEDGPGGIGDGSTDNTLPGQGDFSLSIDDVAKRDFAIDAGVQAQWYFESGGRLTFEWFNDVSGVYQGNHGALSYAHGFVIDKLHVNASVGVKYKSADLVDYYYGIDNRDEVASFLHYNASETISPMLSFDMRYALSDDWHFLSFLRYEKLDDGMKDSPLVRKDHVATGFVGVSYDF